MLRAMSAAADRTDDARVAPRRVRARLDRHGLVVEDEARAECLRFDAEGRFTAWHRGPTAIRRTLLGDVGVRRRGRFEPGTPDEALALAGHVARRAAELDADLARGDVALEGGGAERDAVRAALARAAAWDAARHDAERRRARAVYPDGIPILPPHRYRDVIVEPARGCPNGRCSFCAFYRGRRFDVLDDAAFDAHLRDVAALCGAALPAHDGVFLGSASAASIPDAVLVPRLERLTAALGRRPRGIAAFLDPDRAPRRTVADWERLVRADLRDVTVGLESGDPALRAEAGKSGDVAAFVDAVRRAKAGGVRVAVCVLVGLVGAAPDRGHVEATCAALARMGLDPDDLVYVSPLEGSMPADALEERTRALRDAAIAATPARVRPYGADAFAAFA